MWVLQKLDFLSDVIKLINSGFCFGNIKRVFRRFAFTVIQAIKHFVLKIKKDFNKN